MTLDPDSFKGMTPGQMIAALVLDAAGERERRALSLGAHCVQCMDTGIDSAGVFCGCSAGAKLSYQGNKKS